MTDRGTPSAPVTGLRRLFGGRVGPLLLARVVEQASFGLVSLLLARWVGTSGYVVVGAILVFNSFATVAANLGLGPSILTSEVGAVSAIQVRRARAASVALAFAGGTAAWSAGGGWRSSALLCALVWIASFEAVVRKSALIRTGRSNAVARLEIGGALAFLLLSVSVAAAPEHGVTLVASACLLKNLIEAVGSRGWRSALGPRRGGGSIAIWWSQLLAYVIANVDFVIIGLLISSTAFSIYSIGFRAASLVTSQVAFAVGRIVSVDLADARGDHGRAGLVYLRAQKRLFLAGAGVMVVSMAAAPLIPVALGSAWSDAAWVVVLLSAATPWRMVIGTTGAMLMAGDDAPRLVRMEVGRLAATVVVLCIAAQGGLWWFSGAVSVVLVASTLTFDRLARRTAGTPTWRPMWAASAPLVFVVLITVAVLSM